MLGNWITSDLHFDHESVMKFCPNSRPYRGIEDMRQALITEWNSKVKPNHTIYHIGDFIFGRFGNITNRAEEILEQLNGKKIFIKGNHDSSDVVRALQKYGEVYDYLELKYDKRFIVLSHYPIACWNKARYDSLMFYGHCHGSFQNQGKSIDVGFDAQGGKIISLDEAIRLADSRQKVILDGH